MRAIFTLFLILAANLHLQAQNITLEKIWVEGLFSPVRSITFQARKSGNSFVIADQGTIYEFSFNISTAETPKPLNTWEFKTENKKIQFQDFAFSPSEQWTLLTISETSIYRYSTKGKYFIGNNSTGEAWPLHETEEVMYPCFSPDEKYISFVLNNDLYVREVPNGQLIRLTHDGKINSIINGASDWVYEEEFETIRAYEWSPDGKFLAFLRFDEEQVPSVTLEYFYPDKNYSVPYTFKYPKVGEPNSAVTLHLIDMSSKTVFPAKIPEPYEYMPRIHWLGNQLAVTTLNRLQNQMTIWTGKPQDPLLMQKFYSEKSDTYIDWPYDFEWIEAEKKCLITSERDGFRHIYSIDPANGSVKSLTSGTWEVGQYIGYHPSTRKIYFTAGKDSPLERQLYATDWKGKITALTHEPGWHDIHVSGDYFTDSYSSADKPHIIRLCHISGKQVIVLEENQKLVHQLAPLALPPTTFIQVPADDGTTLNGILIRPHHQKPGKKYPLLMYVYGGPGNQRVTNRWMGADYGWFHYLAERGIAVACVDNRGTGGRGKAFREITYGRLGEIETQDQVAAAKHFGKMDFIDSNRISIFGWSYGGFIAARCMTNGEGVFRAGISVAPVTNWKYYDNIYTERYMGTLQTNPDGFDAQSPVRFAQNLNGDFLLVHGSGDDNVHWQNTAVLSNALIRAGKDFEQFIYPNRDHGIYGDGARLHLYRKMSRFLFKSLDVQAND